MRIFPLLSMFRRSEPQRLGSASTTDLQQTVHEQADRLSRHERSISRERSSSEPPTYNSLPQYTLNNQDELVLSGQPGLSETQARLSDTQVERLLHGGIREDGQEVPAFLRDPDAGTMLPSPAHNRTRQTARPSVRTLFDAPAPESTQPTQRITDPDLPVMSPTQVVIRRNRRAQGGARANGLTSLFESSEN